MRYIVLISTMVVVGSAAAQTPDTASVALATKVELLAPGVINSPHHDFSPAEMADGRGILFTVTDVAFSRMSIVESRRENDKWQTPVVVSFSGTWNDGDVALSPDGKRAFFISNRPGIKGDTAKRDLDIWTVQRTARGWGEPTRLPSSINTDTTETYPSVAADGSLYFGRAGKFYRAEFVNGSFATPELLPFTGFSFAIAPDQSFAIYGAPGSSPQDLDLFIRYRQSGVWSAPRKLAAPLSTPATQDLAGSISPDGKRLYLVSTRRLNPVTWPRAKPLRTRTDVTDEINSNVFNGLRNIYVADISGLKTAHYDLQIDIDQAAGDVATDARIRLPASFVGDQATFIISGAQKVASATAVDASVEVSETDVPWKGLQKIVVTRKNAGTPFDIRIQSRGKPNPGGTLPINIVSANLVELSLDGMWLPVLLGFTTPFTVQANIAGLDTSMEVVAAGNVRRSGNAWMVERTVGDGDFAFAAMSGIKTKKSPRFILFAQDTTTATARAFWRHGQAAISYLENWFGQAAVEPVKTVIIRRERASGYARKGYIVVTESSRTGEAAVGKFIAHEIAHLWWAPVDPNTEDRWLQESIAEYAALRYVEHALGTSVRDSIVAQKRVAAASAGPILGTTTRTDRELYDKGPLLLIELEEAIGRARLDAVLTTLARKPPTTTAHFMNVLREVAGDAAAMRFDQRMRS